ncbi:MAG: hypothetical protein R2879_20475 [Saprospiraceae bacterium]
MNFKFNYWTVLFCFSLGTLWFSCNQEKTTFSKMEDILPNYRISAGLFDTIYGNYQNSYIPFVDSINLDSIIDVTNSDILYYTLPFKELELIYHTYLNMGVDTPKIRLYPVIQEIDNHREMDMVIQVSNGIPDSPDEGYYFDFTSPCPPCEGN